MKKILLLALITVTLGVKAQNLVKNGNLQQTVLYWDMNGCQPQIGGTYTDMSMGAPPYNFEAPHFNGISTTNILCCVNGCMNQAVCLFKDQSYTLSFKHQRRSFADPFANMDPPATTAVRAIVRGLPSFTDYVDATFSDSNPGWVNGWYTSNINFTVPASSTDNDFRVIFVQATIVPTEFGCIIDDISLTPNPAFSTNGPTTAGVNSGTNWSINNIPASGVTYNWSFPGATPSSSTSATPANVQWNSQGTKTVTCVLGNGTCTVATLTQNINITSPLPVDITSFTATAKQNAAELQWVTGNEINNDYFIVYKSKDGVNFTEAGRVQSAGISTGATYKFTDAQPGAGVVYYRLRQVDKNGAYKSTGVVKLRFGSSGLDVSVYPTIVTDVLNYAVETPQTAKMYVTVTDMSGKKLEGKTENFISGTSIKTINTSALAKGIYLLTVTNGAAGFSKTIKFTKN
jgi:Secretion system C-terminal sorting domain